MARGAVEGLHLRYDIIGEEMAPDARVWRKYVEEADNMDRELVKGWTETLDIILVLTTTPMCSYKQQADQLTNEAALFSAISTAFVIESLKDMKPDYNASTAQTLLLISEMLMATSNASVSRGNNFNELHPEVSEFVPTRSVIIVNVLWFMSLSLSVAVSLVAILAKDWCYWLMAGRTGTTLRQGRLRQQRWDGITQWRMQEILYLLPMMMHIALLLFAIGLSVYLWDIDTRVALPVVIITVLVTLFYFTTASLSLLFQFCPYKTSPIRLLHSFWLRLIYHRYSKTLLGLLTAVSTWLSGVPQGLLSLWETWRRNRCDVESRQNSVGISGPPPFGTCLKEAEKRIEQWAKKYSQSSLGHRSQLVDRQTPMDNVTSSMLSWMVTNCEDSRSVDIALQALANADMRLLPRGPLWKCGAVELVSQRLKLCLNSLPSGPSTDFESRKSNLLIEASLYSRSLVFLTDLVRGEGFEITNKLLGSSNGVLFNSNNKKLRRLNFETGDTYHCLLHVHRYVKPKAIDNSCTFPNKTYNDSILNCSWNGPTSRSAISAFALSSVPFGLDQRSWEVLNQERKQCSRQWELLQGVTSGTVTNLPSNVILGLVQGITKTYLYNPKQSPVHLVDLLHTSSVEDHPELVHAIGVALTIAAFANHEFPREHHGPHNEPRSDVDPCLARAKEVYCEILTREETSWRTDTYLSFGLLGMVRKPAQSGGWNLTAGQIRTIVLRGTSHSRAGYYGIIPTLPNYYERELHVAHMISDWFDSAVTHEPTRAPEFHPDIVSSTVEGLAALICPALCMRFNDDIIALLIQQFDCTPSMELKKLCLQGIQHSIAPSWSLNAVLDRLARTNFVVQALDITTIETASNELTLHTMSFLWATVSSLIDLASQPIERRHPATPSMLQPIYNRMPALSLSDGLPSNITDLGLADLWISKLVTMCRDSPKEILDSKILDYMQGSYGTIYGNAKPFTTELPHPFDSEWSWFRILQHLQGECLSAVSQDRGEEPMQEAAVHQVEPGVSGENEGMRQLCKVDTDLPR